MNAKPDFVIVIGASAGGLKAISTILAQFQPDLNAAVFVVHHLHKKIAGDFIFSALSTASILPCIKASNNVPIQRGYAYIACSNEHMIVKRGKIVMGNGPEENRWRPSIDVLFRSAAAAYNSRVIGIVLTGLLSDGTAGMVAIQRSGGKTVVQDPKEAEYPSMPTSVMQQMEVDYCVPLDKIGEIVLQMLQTVPNESSAPEDVIVESNIVERSITRSDSSMEIGEPSLFACPDCGGPLFHLSDEYMSRYRCHIGHVYSELDLLIRQGESAEFSLWVAVRLMEERRTLYLKMASDAQKKGYTRTASDHTEKAAQLETHINRLKEVLVASEKNNNHGFDSISPVA